ncbi:hypothetical protein BOX15_Mlig006023g1, partial [Macrostomum lignano]
HIDSRAAWLSWPEATNVEFTTADELDSAVDDVDLVDGVPTLRFLSAAALTEDSNFLRNHCLSLSPPRSVWPQLVRSAIKQGHSLSLVHLATVWPFDEFSVLDTAPLSFTATIDSLQKPSRCRNLALSEIWSLICLAVINRCRNNSASSATAPASIRYHLPGQPPSAQQQFAFLDQLASCGDVSRSVQVDLDVAVEGHNELLRLASVVSRCYRGQLRLRRLCVASVHPMKLLSVVNELKIGSWRSVNEESLPISVCLTDTDLRIGSLSQVNASQLWQSLLDNATCLDLSRSRLDRRSVISLGALLGLASVDHNNAANATPMSSRLQHLNLSGNPGIQLPSFGSIVDNLTALCLAGCRLRANSSDLLAVMNACRLTLQHLDLSDNPLLLPAEVIETSGASFYELFRLQRLSSLRLACLTSPGGLDREIGANGRNSSVALLLDSVLTGCPKLCRLDISDWPVGTRDWATSLLPILLTSSDASRSHSLKLLVLSWPRGYQADDWSDGSGEFRDAEDGEDFEEFQAELDIEARDSYAAGVDRLQSAGCGLVWV